MNYFLEGEHLLVDGQKMSKSLRNIYRLSDLEERGIDPLAFRYLALGTHYRAKLNFTWESLEAAVNALHNLRTSLLRMSAEIALGENKKRSSAADKKSAGRISCCGKPESRRNPSGPPPTGKDAPGGISNARP